MTGRQRRRPSAGGLAATIVACGAALVAGSPAMAATPAVFSGDPVDVSTGLAYPVMPGLPLLLPGNDGTFGTDDDVVNSSITGDVDLVVRVGDIPGGVLPPPAGQAGGASVVTVEAGGGVSGQGTEAPFTVILSDGAANPPYGNAITSTELDGRPVAVYAFADLDGDGWIGPTQAGQASAGNLERQEATAFVGRQVGVFSHGRLQASLGIAVGAPASIGGLDVVLSAGAYTGSNGALLDTDGTLILTHWPFFPPLDPNRVVDLASPHPPDPAFPSQLEFDLMHLYLPAPGDPVLGTPFAMAVVSGEPTIDHLKVVSGPATSAGLFAEAANEAFAARHATDLRVAPPVTGPGRVALFPPSRVALAGAGAQVSLRVLPTDSLGNVADPAAPRAVTVRVRGEIALASPDADANPASEPLSLDDARGRTITIAATGPDGEGRVEVLDGATVLLSVPVVVGSAVDGDMDSVPDDGSMSGLAGDRPCDGGVTGCDDNCPGVGNPSQLDEDHDGVGDCCDGTCLAHPGLAGCSECASAAAPVVAEFRRVRLRVRPGSAGGDDTLDLAMRFGLPDAMSDNPASLHLALALTQSGSAGYFADLAGIPLSSPVPLASYRYEAPAGGPGGILSVLSRQRRPAVFQARVKAQGPALVGLAGGAAHLVMDLGGEGTFDEDDILAVDLACRQGSRAIHCRYP